MKKLLFMLLAVAALVSCESEYDKMSEYEKVIYDVGTSSAISAEDALKNTELWKAVKIISSTEPGGRGKVSIVDHEKETLYGSAYYYFSFKSALRFYIYNGPNVTIYDNGVDNPPSYHYYSYYIDYDYTLNSDAGIKIDVKHNLEESWTNPLKKMSLAAYNESCIVIDVDYGPNSEYRYHTYLLKPSVVTDIEQWEKRAFIDIESFVKWKNGN